MPAARPRALFVAEKPSIAKTLAEVLSNGAARHRASQFARYNHMFEFELDVQSAVHPALPYEGRHLDVTVTSVCGHLMTIDFADKTQWRVNAAHCFEDRIVESVIKGSEDIYQNLANEAQRVQLIVVWTDCDREGEAIGAEIVRACQSTNPTVAIRRARFSAANQADLWRAVNSLRDLNANEILAVEARSEIDLRLGAAFTRFQTLVMQQRFDQFANQVVSFGSCQFPTLGFVVARFEAIESFVEEAFYHIRMAFQCARRAEQDEEENNHNAAAAAAAELFHFTWHRHRVYDFACALACYQLCVDQPLATVVQVTRKPKSKWRPVPLSTVELQVRASKWCRLASESAMKAAELLYQRGIVSYPRTETEVFAESFDLQALVHEHRASPLWGAFASKLLDDGGFQWPRAGAKNDQAHPPIHPLKFVPLESLADDSERRVYELIVRHFLACCSKDAEGAESVLRVQVAGEQFTATGLQVFHRNYLDVYPFEKWGERAMPSLVEGDTFVPTVLELAEGKTSPPELMSEAELIRIMDSTGIGTDATIADHIKTVQERQYVVKFGPQNRFKPTDLGLALVRTYNRLGHDRAISKPELRAAMERDLVRICRGETNKDAVVHSAVAKYRAILTSVLAHKDGFLQAVAENLSNAIAPADADYAELLAAQFSRCGRCRQPACELRRSAVNGVKALVCANCGVVCAPLPKPDDIRARAETCPICQYQVLEFASDPQRPPRAFCPSCFCHSPAEMNAGDVEDVGQLPCFRCAKPGCALATGVQQTPVGECGTCGQPITVKRAQDRPSYYVQCTPRCPGARATVFVPSNAREVGVTADACPLCPRFRVLKLRFAPGDVPIAPPYELVECARTECRSHSSDYQCVVEMASHARGGNRVGGPQAPRVAAAPPPTPTPQPQANVPGQPGAAAVLCPKCTQPMLQLASSSANNPGRLFHKCQPCNVFEWADEPRRGSAAPPPATQQPPPRMATTMPQPRAHAPPPPPPQQAPCYHCRGRDHLPIHCPTQAAPANAPPFGAPPFSAPRPGVTCFKCGQPGHFANSCPGAPPMPQPHGAVPRGFAAAAPFAAPQARGAAGVVCFKCNAPGHFASSCPGAAAASTRATAFNSRQPFAQQQQQQQSGKPKAKRPGAQRACERCATPLEPRKRKCAACGYTKPKTAAASNGGDDGEDEA